MVRVGKRGIRVDKRWKGLVWVVLSWKGLEKFSPFRTEARGAAEPRGEGMGERAEHGAAEPPTHPASPMVLRCIVGE